MDWKTFVVQKCVPLATGIVIGACATVRTIEICRIDIKEPLEKSVGHCSEGSKNYDKPIQDMHTDWCTTEDGFKKILDRLEDCERRCP